MVFRLGYPLESYIYDMICTFRSLGPPSIPHPFEKFFTDFVLLAAFQRGDLLFLWNRGMDTKIGEIVVYNVRGVRASIPSPQRPTFRSP